LEGFARRLERVAGRAIREGWDTGGWLVTNVQASHHAEAPILLPPRREGRLVRQDCRSIRLTPEGRLVAPALGIRGFTLPPYAPRTYR
jgi:hypothetical protein